MAKANIMIVEDEAIVGKELRASIEGMGYTVTSVVKTGEKALEKAVQDRPNLILMDIKLKGQMDGIKAYKLIRSSVDIPVIFLTAYADDERLERAKLTMPFGYILKPFQDSDLKVTIEMGLYAAEINAKRMQAEEALRKAHDELEVRVDERTGELAKANEVLSVEISERKWAEKELSKSVKLLQAVFDGISDTLIMVDKNMKILMKNKAARAYYKLPEGQNCLNKPCHQVFNRDPNSCMGCNIPSIVLSREHKSFERKGFMCPEIIEQIVVYPIEEYGNEVEGAIIRITDITKARQVERELIHADKMISLGTLVSGVAHEINNPNNFVMLNTPLLSDAWKNIVPLLEKHYKDNGDFSMGGLPYSEMRDEVPKLFSGIEEGSNRIKKIVQGLKDFARQDRTDNDQLIMINTVIKNSIILTGNIIKRSTKNFTVHYGKELPSIRGSEQRLSQVIINLIQNACQALPDIKKSIFVTSSYDKDQGAVVVELRDEGRGIAEESLKRIMDPFYTTRRSEGGTGLGLSVSSTIVKEHGGLIRVKSKEGKGTIFTVLIPAANIQEPIKILLVDDEPNIREVLSTALRKHRYYSVREASNGAEAFLKIGQELPDILILDIQMPDMDGVEVCRLIKEKPELSNIKILVITAFPESSKTKEVVEMGFNKIVKKPFRLSVFFEMLEEIAGVVK